MYATASKILSLLILSATGLSQFVTPPPDDTFKTVDGPLGLQVRYKEVSTGPGTLCELNSSVKSYSGFVDVSPNEHVFFWLFEARDVRPSDAHFTAWISGGPGASSMSELFTEHGPCRIDEKLNPTNNPYSWNTFSNMVYIDQPIQVGFSYSDPIPAYADQHSCDLIALSSNACPTFVPKNDNCDNYGSGVCGTFSNPNPIFTANSTPGAAPNFWLALQGLYAAFPNYTQHGFTLGSESYGGHYAPIFSKYIYDQNQDLPDGSANIPLQSVMVNNGWFDPAVAYAAAYQFLVNPGNTYNVTLPSEKPAERMYIALNGTNNCLDRLAQCNGPNGTDVICKLADDFCTADMQNIYGRKLGRDEYDVRELDPDPFPNSYYVDYLNTEPVLTELAVFTNYTDQSKIVGKTFEATGDDGKELGITQALTDLLDAGVSITLLHGDADYDCNWYGGMAMVENIAAGSRTAGLTEAYNTAGFQNLSTSDGVVHGQVKQAGRLTFVRVYQAGHQVGFFQPLAEQTIFERTISDLDISHGKENVSQPVNGSLYESQGPSYSTYVEGNATVQYHVLPADATYNTKTNEPNP